MTCEVFSPVFESSSSWATLNCLVCPEPTQSSLREADSTDIFVDVETTMCFTDEDVWWEWSQGSFFWVQGNFITRASLEKRIFDRDKKNPGW